MTPEQLAEFRDELRLSQRSLARILDVDVSTVSRWESGQTRIPAMLDLAAVTIRRYRADLASRGLSYPMMADVLTIMREEGIDQGAAIRRFGVEP